jgi:hypothetical protein
MQRVCGRKQMIKRTKHLVVACVALCSASCSRPYAAELTAAARSITPTDEQRMLADASMLTNEWVGALFETNAPLPVERGIVRLADGTILRFAFLSHHLTKDHESHTVFAGSNYLRNVSGYFCCEVEFGNLKAPRDLKAFDRFLDEVDGSSP